MLGDGGTKTAGAGTIENEGGGTWSYFPTKAETNFAAVTYSFAHADAMRVDVQFNPTGTGASVPTPDPGGLASSYAEYYGGGAIDSTDVLSRNKITIVRNDTCSFGFTVAFDFAGYSGLMTIRHRVTNAELAQVSVTVTSATLLSVSLSSSDTEFPLLVSLTEFGPHPFDIQMTSGSTVKTPVTGIAVVQRDQTT